MSLILRIPRSSHSEVERCGQGARRIEASFFRVDGVVKHLRLGTSRPTREPEALLALFREKLAALDALGLLKIDVLALGMLSCLRRGFDLLERHRAGRR